jgi:cytochrome c553
MSDNDIESLAEHFAAQSCALPTTLGEQTLPPLARRCISCHGEDGRSTVATVPNLAGQQRRYLENQMRAFRDSGARPDEPRTRTDPIMGRQTVTLTDADIVTLAAYFSGRRCR